MAIEIDRTQYPISIDGINSDLQDISAKLDILNEFTDGVVDNHLSETEHHLVHRQKRLLVLLRDVLKDHRSLLYDTEIESNEISHQAVYIPEVYDNSRSPDYWISFSFLACEPAPKGRRDEVKLVKYPVLSEPDSAGVGFTEQEKSAITTAAMRLRANRFGLDCHAYKDEVEENYIKHLLATGIYTKFSVNESDLSLYLHTRNGTTLELVDVLVRRYEESQL